MRSRLLSLRHASFLAAPGVLDAGLASLAGFGAALYAATQFDPALLGAYGLVFAAWMVGGLIPTRLVMTPARVASLSRPPAARPFILRPSLRAALPFALAGAALVPLAWFPAHNAVATDRLVSFLCQHRLGNVAADSSYYTWIIDCNEAITLCFNSIKRPWKKCPAPAKSMRCTV